MKNKSSKSKLRIERKKKKMAALLQVLELNENDRAVKKMQISDVSSILEELPDLGPEAKRQKFDLIEEKETNTKTAEISSSGKTKLDGKAFLQLKRRLRENTKKMRQLPNFRLREMGDNATLKVDPENRIPLFLSDVQHLILYSQIGAHSPYSPARWCALERYNRLLNTNVLIVDNLSMYHFVTNESRFAFLNSTFSHKLEILSPYSYKSDVIKDLSMVPITGTQMQKFINEFGTLDSAVVNGTELFDTVQNIFPIEENTPSEPERSDLPPSDKFPRTQLLLSGWQLVEENFPLPIKGLMEYKFADYVMTKDNYRPVTPSSPMFGIDCEMCRTSSGELELTRISVVDEQMEVLYETFVKPDNKIVDYLTRFSGITPKIMKNVKKKLKDVQNDLREILPGDAILVGQSLSNDMHALKMMHPYVIDTSIIYNITGDRTRKTRLQTLAKEFLSENIQDSRTGHCSTEDSSASLKLAQLKLSKYIAFGDAVLNGVRNEIRSHPEMGSRNYATSLFKQVTKMDKTAFVVAPADVAPKYKAFIDKNLDSMPKNIKCVGKTCSAEVVKTMCATLFNQSLNLAHISVELNERGEIASGACEEVDNYVKAIYSHTAAPGLCIVLFAGSKDYGNAVCFVQLKTLY